MGARVYVNNFATSLSASTTTGATTLYITSATGLPTLSGSDYYHLTIGGGGVTEIVKVTARTATTLTVIREQENTSAIAWASGAPVRMNFTAGSLSLKQDQIAGSTDVIDFGGASSFEIPNSAAPTVNATGEIALDTTITDHKGLIKYYTGSDEMVVVACPTANLTTTDNYALTYDAATDAFDFSAMGSGFTYNTATGTTQAAAVNNGYICTNGSLCTVTLPATAAVGDIVEVQGEGAGIFNITANTGQTIKGVGDTTSSAGSVTPAHRYDNIKVMCIVANTTWAIQSFTSTLLTFA